MNSMEFVLLSVALIGLGLTGAASVLVPLPSAPEVSDVAPGAVEAPARVETASSGESGSQSLVR